MNRILHSLHNLWLNRHENCGLPATLVELFLLVRRKAPQKKDPLRELRAKAASTSEKFLIQVRNRASNFEIFPGSRLVFASLFSEGNPIRNTSLVSFLKGAPSGAAYEKLSKNEWASRNWSSAWSGRNSGGLPEFLDLVFLPRERGAFFFAQQAAVMPQLILKND